MASLHNVLLRADVPRAIKGTVSESYPHLIFEGFTTRLGLRIVKILKHLFPPRDPTARKNAGNRVITFGISIPPVSCRGREANEGYGRSPS